MQGDRWRQMRATLKKLTDTGKRIDHEMKDLLTRYANDVIATCAFGVNVNSVEIPNNDFF